MAKRAREEEAADDGFFVGTRASRERFLVVRTAGGEAVGRAVLEAALARALRSQYGDLGAALPAAVVGEPSCHFLLFLFLPSSCRALV